MQPSLQDVLELPLTSLTKEYKCSKVRLQMKQGFQRQVHQYCCISPGNWVEVDTIQCSAASYISLEAQRHCGGGISGKMRFWLESKCESGERLQHQTREHWWSKRCVVRWLREE